MLLGCEAGCAGLIGRRKECEVEHTILLGLLGLKGRDKTEEISKFLVVIWGKTLRTEEGCTL